MPQKISLYQIVEMPNGTVNMDTLLSVVSEGEVVFRELPDKAFDLEKDRDILERLLQDYQKRGVKEIQKYGE